MGNVIWDNVGGVANDGNDAANYTPARVPTIGDVADFDSATTSDNCTFSGNISCDGMLFATAYAGIMDAATHDIALGSDGLDCTGGGSATLTPGSGTWTIGGDFDFEDVGTIGAGTFILTGAANILRAKNFQHTAITIAVGASYTHSAGQTDCRVTDFTCDGDYTIGVGYHLKTFGAVVIAATGEVNGGGTLWSQFANSSNGITSLAGTLTCPVRVFNPLGCVWASGTYGSTFFVDVTGGAGYTCQPAANTLTFADDFEIQMTGSGSITIRDDINDPSYVFQGDVTIDEQSGTIAWTPGTGTITFDGTNSRDVDFNGLSVEAIEQDMSAGTLTLTGNVETVSWTGTDGDLDIGTNNVTLTASGAVDFQAGSTVADLAGATIACVDFTAADIDFSGATGAWYLNASNSATITGGVTINYLDARGGVEVDADGCVEGPGCFNVNFGGAILNQFMGSNVGADLFNGALI